MNSDHCTFLPRRVTRFGNSARVKALEHKMHMAVRREITEYSGIYFITVTCSRWLRLFEIVNAYDEVYKWFDHLKGKGHYILGYVIMPNHIHALIGFRQTQGASINSIVGEGKRFMSYGMVKRLKIKGEEGILTQLTELVNTTDRKRGKIHEVFEPSFDWKECRNNKFIWLNQFEYWQRFSDLWDFYFDQLGNGR